MKMSPASWVLCGRSRITPVTFRETVAAWQAVSVLAQSPRPVTRVRPMGSASPKYFRAADCDRTTDSG